jgi:hypothetical protein
MMDGQVEKEALQLLLNLNTAVKKLAAIVGTGGNVGPASEDEKTLAAALQLADQSAERLRKRLGL